MMDQFGTHLIEFLQQRCAALTGEHNALSLQVQQSLPSIGEMPEFIARLSTVREQLPRCESLCAELIVAAANGNDLTELVEDALADIDTSMEPIFSEGQIDLSESAACALTALRELSRDLSGFCAKWQQACQAAPIQFPDPLDALVDERRMQLA